jgi:hypothetical protein
MEAVGLKRAGKEKSTHHAEAELVWRNRILRQKNDQANVTVLPSREYRSVPQMLSEPVGRWKRPKTATEPRALRVPEAMERVAQRRGRREQKRLSGSREPEQKSPPGLGAIRITRGYQRVGSEPSLLRAPVETVRSNLPEGAVYYE